MGFDARAKIKILDACERLLAQESWHGAGQQEGDDRENDHDFDERENVLNVITARHSEKAEWFESLKNLSRPGRRGRSIRACR
jgi:hypothetical protein